MSESTPLEPGATGAISLEVTNQDTAIALGSGDVAVLGTPRVVGLAEQAACAALDGALAADQTTVGVHVDLHHVKPSPVGSRVTATATLAAVDGRKLDFTIAVADGPEQVAHGTHRRVIVSRSAFAD